IRHKVAFVKPQKHAGKVRRPAAHAPAGVVVAQSQRIAAGHKARLLPAELLHGQLVAGKVGGRVPKGSRLDDDDTQPGLSQPLREHPARRPRPDNADVDDLVAVLAAAEVRITVPRVVITVVADRPLWVPGLRFQFVVHGSAHQEAASSVKRGVPAAARWPWLPTGRSLPVRYGNTRGDKPAP